MKTKTVYATAVFLVLLGGAAGGLYPLLQLAPELVEAERARLEANKPDEPEDPWDFWTVEMEALSDELEAVRGQLDERAARLDARESRIAAEMTELEETRSQLESIRREIDKTMVRVEASEAKNLRALSKTYAALEPAAAITILSEMDDATVVKLLALMKPESVADIFNQMGLNATGPDSIRRAARLSEKLRLFERSDP